jgi:hypothetical protein
LLSAGFSARSCVDFRQILAKHPEEHTIDPLAVPPIRLTTDALADESGTFRVLDRAYVESVALELQTVVVELDEQVALEKPRGSVGEPAAAKGRVNSEAAEVRDAAPPVRDVEAEHAGGAPAPLVVDLDHESPALAGAFLRAPDFREQALAVSRSNGGEVRLDVLVGEQLHEEVDVLVVCAPQA